MNAEKQEEYERNLPPEVLAYAEVDRGSCDMTKHETEEGSGACTEDADYALLIDRDVTDDGFNPSAILACEDHAWGIHKEGDDE